VKKKREASPELNKLEENLYQLEVDRQAQEQVPQIHQLKAAKLRE
jgi:hypothetical protein